MKLNKDQAQFLAYGGTDPELEVEANEYTGSGRWESHHFLVVKDKAGRFWSATYSQGLTESQDITPFEDDGDEIEFKQVEKVPVTAYEYREIKPGDGGDREPSGDSPDSPAAGKPGLPGVRCRCPHGKHPAKAAGDDPRDLWANILRVEPDEFIRASMSSRFPVPAEIGG